MKTPSVSSAGAVAMTASVVLLAYAAWIGGPFLRSIVVRDAAVTTWISVAQAPIDGYLGQDPLYAGDRVGSDGRIVDIDNPLADATKPAQARADLERAETQVTDLKELVATLEAVVQSRSGLAAQYAASFRLDLEAQIEGTSRTIPIITRRLEIERSEARRMAGLLEKGAVSHSEADAALARVTEQERALAEAETARAQARLRLTGARKGVLLLADGSDGATVQRSLEQGREELKRARADLAVAQAEAAALKTLADAADDLYGNSRTTRVPAPPNAVVWSLIGGPGSSVRAGSPVASWIDCSIMLVDVPLSDVEVALLPEGADAEVVLEGEKRVRPATLLFTRGSAATLDTHDLAAIAKGRHSGVAQAILQLRPDSADVAACPVGHAAFVDFPSVGVIDVILSRLRV